jgi:hypothetical protein
MRCNAHSLLPVAQIGEMELEVGRVFAHAQRVFDHRAAGRAPALCRASACAGSWQAKPMVPPLACVAILRPFDA